MAGSVPPAPKRRKSAEAGSTQRRVTRGDVARYAGVSTAVVSYVLNDGPRPVAAATAARVREAMELLHYRPNLSARALKRGTSQTLGLVVPDARSPYFGELIFEVERVAATHGHRLLTTDSMNTAETEAELVEELIARQVDGLILISAFERHDPLAGIRSYGVPSVLLDCPGPVPGRATVGPDALGGTMTAIAHLADVHGKTAIALAMGSGGFGNPDPRERGWETALAERGLRRGPLVRTDWSREGGYAAGRELLQLPQLPDAVFASSDEIAVGILLALHEAGVNVGPDVALISFDGTAEARFSWPPLTTVRQPVAEMAAITLDLIENPETTPTHHECATTLVIRNSCGCTPAPTD